MPEYLTTKEVAELLRIKERKVYELVSAGFIPASRATGKLLFPYDLVDAWVRRQIDYRGLAPPPESRPQVICGSHDPLFEWAIRESGCNLATLFAGSLDGLGRMAKGQCVAASTHLLEPGDDGAGDWNVRHVSDRLHGEPVVLLEWMYRQQGLLVAAGNPLGIAGVADLAGRRFVPRQRDAGARVLFDHLLVRTGLVAAELSWIDPPARSESDVALYIAEGKADAGLAIQSVARQHRLHFIPLMRERFDLLVWRRDYFEEPWQVLLDFCRGGQFEERAAELGGYEVIAPGRVVFNAGC